jgi:4-hydroxy-2-oxoheptanedioate aldolase
MSGLLERLRAGEVVTGAFLQLASPLAAEAFGLAGFDWLVIDLEHGPGTESDAVAQLQALQAHGAAGIVRVESREPIRIGRALDAGADGVLVPRLSGVADAVSAAAACRYASGRGVARYTRSWHWGARPGTLADADQLPLCAVQIETRGALDALDEIAAVDGVDVLFVGPSDLAHALGLSGDPTEAALLEQTSRVAAAARRYGKAAGVLVATASQAAAYVEAGFTFVGAGSDAGLLMNAATTRASALAELAGRTVEGTTS